MPAELARLRLLQLTSPALPIGAFACSQSLESAVTLGWVDDADSLADWIGGLLSHGLGRLDLPILARQIQACAADQQAEAVRWNRHLLASRESGELRLEDRQLGAALLRLLTTLEGVDVLDWLADEAACFGVAQVTLFGWAAARFGIEPAAALEGFAFAWLENQLTAATKLMPLGQSRAQRLLSGFLPRLPALVEQALQCDDSAIGAALPGMAFASGRHESQYCRLFRS